MMSSCFKIVLAFFAASALLAPHVAAAEEAPAIPSNDAAALIKALQEQAARLAEQERKLSEHEKSVDAQKRTLTQEKIQFNKLKTQVEIITGKSVDAAGASPMQQDGAAPSASDQATSGGEQEKVGTDRKPNSEKPPEIAAVIEQGGVLLQKGRLVVTPSVEYARSAATRVAIEGLSVFPAINIGLFEITKVNRDTLTGAVQLRYGVTNRFEVEAKVPYVYRNDATTTRPIGVVGAPETLSAVSSHDVGDVEVAAHYQINNGQRGWPYLIANLRVKSATGTSPFEVPVIAGVQQKLPTGSGFYGVQPSLTAIYPSDPVVFYSNVGYLYNFSRSFPGTGTIEPGDSVSASFGMSMSLNDRASFSLGYSHNTVFSTKQNGASLANSTWLQVGTLDLGYAYTLTDRTSLNFAVSAGMTNDAPDARLVFRVPMAFDLK